MKFLEYVRWLANLQDFDTGSVRGINLRAQLALGDDYQ
jgi:hypothetical protein